MIVVDGISLLTFGHEGYVYIADAVVVVAACLHGDVHLKAVADLVQLFVGKLHGIV